MQDATWMSPQPSENIMWPHWTQLQETACMGAETMQNNCSEAPLAMRGRAARRRLGRQQKREEAHVYTAPPQSAAEKLELLSCPFPKVAATMPPPLAFPTGVPLFQQSLPSPDEWCLEEVCESQDCSEGMIERLEVADKTDKAQLVEWILKAPMVLALSKHGCRVVQKALEVCNSSDRDALVGKLEPFLEQLYVCQNGNYVLTKIVEVMPSAAIGGVIAKLSCQVGQVARHKFGCRVLERLIEHCDESQMGDLIDEIVADAGALCRHPYGNFVVQHLIEHSPSHRAPILDSILEDLPILACHRTGSWILQKIMDYAEENGKRAIVAKILEAESPYTIVEVACTRPGSYVMEQLAGMSEAGEEVTKRILAGSEKLKDDEFGKRILECFNEKKEKGENSAREENARPVAQEGKQLERSL